MPFIAADKDYFYNMEKSLPREGLAPLRRVKRAFEEFEYAEARVRFEASALEPVARTMLEGLISLGAKGMKGSYDGGCDEGWAFAEEVLFASGAKDAKDACRELASTQLVNALRKAGEKRGAFGEDDSADRVIADAMDDLAMELASALLFKGFGTGEYVIYGDFEADFATGVIVDDPGAMRRRRRGGSR